MMRTVVSVGLCVFAVVACSASSSEDECPFIGTYAVTGTQNSGDCEQQASSSSGTASTAYTVTAAPPSSGVDYALEIQGATGRCGLTKIGTCKLQGKCDVALNDALDPNDRIGTFQYSWTFDKAGFKGSYSTRIPKAKTLPNGCSAEGSQTGARR